MQYIENIDKYPIVFSTPKLRSFSIKIGLGDFMKQQKYVVWEFLRYYEIMFLKRLNFPIKHYGDDIREMEELDDIDYLWSLTRRSFTHKQLYSFANFRGIYS